jgi:hypothetical protein
MKRELSPQINLGSDHKRPRLDDTYSFFDDANLERFTSDILQDTSNHAGYFTAEVYMIWLLREKIRMNVQVRSGSAPDAPFLCFDVEFVGSASEGMQRLKSVPEVGDSIRLSLKGCEALQAKPSSGRKAAPIKLKFTTGAVFRIEKRRKYPDQNGVVVDTWQG